VPSIAAGNHGFVGIVSTPPQTPRSTTSSVNGVKRDASESENERGEAGPEKKKRRVAPTPVGSSLDNYLLNLACVGFCCEFGLRKFASNKAMGQHQNLALALGVLVLGLG
jgi:hypothetical protein